MAPKADLRPFQIAALSASDCETFRLVGLKGLAISTMRASIASHSSLQPSTSMISIASASSG